MMDGRGGGRTIGVASVDGVGVSGAEFYDIANVADLLQGREGRGMSTDIRATGWVKSTQQHIAQGTQRSRLCSLL